MFTEVVLQRDVSKGCLLVKYFTGSDLPSSP